MEDIFFKLTTTLFGIASVFLGYIVKTRDKKIDKIEADISVLEKKAPMICRYEEVSARIMEVKKDVERMEQRQDKLEPVLRELSNAVGEFRTAIKFLTEAIQNQKKTS